jgi:hypothetical protein
LAFIEKRFMSTRDKPTPETTMRTPIAIVTKQTLAPTQHLTKRDQFANRLEDMFDFDAAPLLAITLTKQRRRRWTARQKRRHPASMRRGL